MVGLTKLGHDVRHTSVQAADKVHKHLIGQTALAVTAGFTLDDKLPDDETDPDLNVNVNLNSRENTEKLRQLRQTTPVFVWSDAQDYLLKRSPTNVLFTSDFGTGEFRL